MAEGDAITIAGATVGSPEWWLGKLTGRLDARQAPMKLADDYYHGRQRKTYKIAQAIEAFGMRDIPLFVNYCAVVVDAVNERLGVNGFRFADDEAIEARAKATRASLDNVRADAEAAASEAWRIWQASSLDATYKRGLRVGLTKGEFSLLVWPDADGEPRFYVEDGAEVVVDTDPADRRKRRAGLKRWIDGGVTYATLYLPTDGARAAAIYKFQAGSDRLVTPQLGDTPPEFGRGGGAGRSKGAVAIVSEGWHKRTVDGEEWPLPNQFADVPIFPLPNRPGLDGVGESEIWQMIPIQDAINANVANAMLAGLYGAFRQKWATNVELEIDEKTGKPKEPWDVAIDKLMTAPPPADGSQNATEFGQFEQSSLDGYIKLHETLVQSGATITRLPVHYFLGSQGSFPSGESLTAAERGLSEKARERMVDFGDPTEDAMRFAFRIKAAQPGITATKKAQLLRWAAIPDAEIVPRDPETRVESEHFDALTKLRALDVPRRAVWAKIPASPQEIKAWEAELEAEPPEKPGPAPAVDPNADPAAGAGGPTPPAPQPVPATA